MQNIKFKTFTVLIILVACALSIFPPEKKLRLGRDLAGGVSLIYTINVAPDAPPEAIDRTIEVIKERVNPNGALDIQFQLVGRDRLEITMPLPTEKVKALKASYDQALEELQDFNINIDAFERALRLTGEERREAFDSIITDQPDNTDRIKRRHAVLDPVLAAAEAATEARAARDALQPELDAARQTYNDAVAAYQAAVESQLAEEELEVLREAQQAAADARNALLDQDDALSQVAAEKLVDLDKQRRRVLTATVSPEEMRRALSLSDEPIPVVASDGSIVKQPSRQTEAIASIRERIGSIADGDEVINEIMARHVEYTADRQSLDDPNDLVRLLQGAGVLEFRISVTPGFPSEAQVRERFQEQGPERASTNDGAWFPLKNLQGWYDSLDDLESLKANPPSYFSSKYRLVAERYGGEYYVLLHTDPPHRMTKEDGDWALASATQSQDQMGRPAVGFEMNRRGAELLGDLTERNKGRQMAILLDDHLYSAPSLDERITRRGIIRGNFSREELSYLIKTMSAGSLQAKLSEEPISRSVVAPELGADNLARGLEASWIALVAVGIFMIMYYFGMGFIAMIALLSNAIIILGAMSLQRAAFTLPGIAGVVLTFGMAVDANVLIYERIREEIFAGNDLKTSVRLAYQKVFSTIIDANVTNLIVCFVLVYTGTQEIKGFAITLGIGIVATLISALLISRIIFTVLIDRVGIGRMRQLPMVVPAIQKAVSPNVAWIRLRPFFWVLSLAAITASVMLMFNRGEEMLDTEFRGGTEITLRLRQEDNSTDRITLTRQQVSERLETIYQGTDDEDLNQLDSATIVVVNPESDGTSSTFKIKTTVTDDPQAPGAVRKLTSAVVDAFRDVVKSSPAITFAGSDATDIDAAPANEILDAELGKSIGRPQVGNDVSEYIDGVAILLENIQPPSTEADIRERLEAKRQQPDFSNTLTRQHELKVIDTEGGFVKTAVLVVRDAAYDPIADEEQWRTELAQQEWDLVRAALTEPTDLVGSQEFSPVIAASFRAKATVAVVISFMLIMIYIWVRFGSVRYSLAALTALVHDVIIALGLIALAEVLYDKFPGLERYGLLPYKINLGLVAAVLTIIGYSLNDTIVILDRIRENRGKLAYASETVINSSINQTLSRTLITSGTTLMALIVMFVLGGEAISSFTYALLCGVLVGTYSSVAVAAPLVFTRKIPPQRPYTSSTPDAAGESNASQSEFAPVTSP